MQVPGATGGSPAGAAVPAPPTEPPAPPNVIVPQSFPGGQARPDQKRCPHCGEDVVGTEAQCPHCGTWFDESRRGQEERNWPEWENRERTGWWPAFWATTRATLLQPEKSFGRMRLTGFGPAIGYGMIGGCVSAVFVVLYNAIMQAVQMALMVGAGGGGGQAKFMALFMFAYLAAMLVFLPFAHLAGLFINAFFTQLGLMIFKCANKPYEATFRVTAYAFSASALLNAIPGCGGLVAWIWGLVAAIIGVAKVHEISYGKSAMAVLLIPGILLVLGVIAIAVFIAIVVAAA